MTLIIVDVEADGPCPGLYSMVSFGAVSLDQHRDPEHGFMRQVGPITDSWLPEALDVSGITREQHLTYPAPGPAMHEFASWIDETCRAQQAGRPVFVSDNPAFDWQFINYYFHRYFIGGNPFGFSARRIGDYFAGLERNFYARQRWKKLRRTKHTHNPLDDARGNAEALAALLHSYSADMFD